MRVLTIVHQADTGPGVFRDPLVESGAEIDGWRPAEEPQPPAEPAAYDAILSFGGDVNPDQDDQHPWLAVEKSYLAGALDARVPMLGVCLGAELIAEAEGSGTRRVTRPEIGWYEVRLTSAGTADPILGAMDRRFAALEWHSYEAVLSRKATALARSGTCLQAFRIGGHAWGIQFHAEVTGPDFGQWLATYTTDGDDLVGEPIDVEAIAQETDAKISAWNDSGRGICERFLQVAARR